jgi:hypothetical protein
MYLDSFTPPKTFPYLKGSQAGFSTGCCMQRILR